MPSEPAGLSDFQLDALKEIGNVGAGNAATALSQMTGRRVGLSVTQVKLLSVESIESFLDTDDSGVVAVYLPVYGDVSGTVFLLFPFQKASELTSLLLGAPSHTPGEFSDMEKSAVQELASILSGAYLGALYKFIGVQMIQGVPTLLVDMAEAILDSLLADQEEKGELAVLIETEFLESGKQLTGSFFLLPEGDGLRKLLNLFSKMLGNPGNA